MARIAFHPSGKSFEFDPEKPPCTGEGEDGSILDLANHFGIRIDSNCGGFGGCGMCQVHIREGMENLSEMTDMEESNVDLAYPAQPESRLACQAVAKGDVVVEIPER